MDMYEDKDTTPSPALNVNDFLEPEFEETNTEEFVVFDPDETQPFNYRLHMQAVYNDGQTLPEGWYEINYQSRMYEFWNLGFNEGIHKLIGKDVDEVWEKFVDLVVEVSTFWEMSQELILDILECTRWDLEYWLSFEEIGPDQAERVMILREYGLYLVMSDQPMIVPVKFCPKIDTYD